MRKGLTNLPPKDLIEEELVAYNVREEDIFPAIREIHPFMQRNVADLIRWCSNIKAVQSLRIFGSSIEHYCSPWSDLDFYVEGCSRREFGYPELTRAVPLDMFFEGEVPRDSSLMEEILKTGVVVYEK